MSASIVILGGYGNTGIKIADLLLDHTDATLILAARNMEKLEASTIRLKEKYSTNKVSSVFADASDKESLFNAFKSVDMVVVASGTSQYAKTVALAALASGIDYLDVQYSTNKVEVLRSLEKQIEESGHCFITDAGYHPGLPAALVRYGAQHFDELKTAIVGSVIKQDWKNLEIAPSTQIEFVQETQDFKSVFFRDGEWRQASTWTLKEFIDVDFGEGLGTHRCVPMFFEEMRPLPEEYPSLKHTGFYITGFNWWVDYVAFPLIIGVLKLFPNKGLGPMSQLMGWSLKTFSTPPYGIALKLEASGEKDGEPKSGEVRLYHEDGYWFTAIPVLACLLQYLDGSIRRPGLWTMGNLVEPNRLMTDMERMGISITESLSE